MSNTKIKAGQFSGVIGNGTDGYFLMSNGDGSMSWVSNIINPTITNVDYPGTATAADPAGGESITLIGTGFKTGATVTIGGTAAPSVSYVSGTQLTITTPAKTAGDYDIAVTNTDTGSATYINGISYNGIPAWTTAAGSLGTFASGATISTITLQASEPDAGTITFNITNGALPTGLSLTGANIDGTTSILNADTLYTFTVTATDDENQATPRTFTITVQKEFISSENFTINTYTGNGSTQSIEGKIGTAADFNGSSSNIVVTDFPITGNSARSYSAWVYTNGSTNGTICGIGDHGTAGQSMYLFIDQTNGGRWSLWGFTATYDIEYASLSALASLSNGWHHFALTWDAASTFKLYIDGSLADTKTKLVIYSTPGIFAIGRWYDSGYWFNSKIDQVRVFNKALSSSEVTTLYGENNTSSTKSKTDIFNDGSGVALYEFEKGAIDTGGTNGYIGSAGVFNGSSSSILLSNTIFNLNNIFSFSAWVNTTKTNYAFIIASRYANNTFSLQMLPNGTVAAGDWQSSANNITTTTTINDGDWHHIVYVNNNGSIVIYIDGSPSATGTHSLVSQTVANGNQIGNWDNDNTASWQGKIDQVRIFNTALNQAKVTTLYGENNASLTKSTTDIFDDGSGVALYELEGNANDAGGTYNGTATNVSYAYDGTPTNVSFVGTSFQPDLVWIKSRSNPSWHSLQDSIRGATKTLFSNETSQETTYTNAQTSFDANGFTLGADTVGGSVNVSSRTYVAWAWKAADTTTTIPAGTVGNTIASNVRANTAAGFSIVKWTGDGTNASIGHGLSSTPEMIIIKPLDVQTAPDWKVYHSALGLQKVIYLNLTQGTDNILGPYWGSINATTFGQDGADISYLNINNNDYIAYCFHSVDGYQKVGSYAGSNSPISISTGFRPRFLMTKRIDTAGSWIIQDSNRRTTNGDALFPNLDAIESLGWNTSFDSDGFTISSNEAWISVSGGTYIYLAIA